jgi:hypothetical protein
MRFYLEYINHLGRLQKKSAQLVRQAHQPFRQAHQPFRQAHQPFRQAHQPVRQAGFTITEVLLAGLMMLIVVVVAGNGVINLLRSNYRANADSEIRNNLNRTLEFVSDDVRRARIIAKTAAAITSGQVPSGARAVLAFQIPNPNSPSQAPLGEQIVYYTQVPEDKDSLTQVPEDKDSLTGPRVLWRYGPSLDENGNYDINTWQRSPVTDMLAETANNTDCPAGFNLIATASNAVDGFSACVHNDGKQVILNANAQVRMTTNEEVNYSVSTRVFPRATGYCDGEDSCSETLNTRIFDLPVGEGDSQVTIPILTVAANVKAEVIQGVNCSSCSVTTGPLEDGWLFQGGPAIPSGEEGITVQANAGDSIRIDVNEDMSNFFWNQNQTVSLYTSDSSNLPSNINSLNNNQVLLVLTSPPNSYQVLVTITPR